MPESLVVSVMLQHKVALLTREQIQMQAMAQRWLQVEQALDAQINALAEEFARLARDGVTPSQAKLFQMDRYQAMLKQLYVELGKYTDYADTLITAQQRAYIAQAIADSGTALQASGVTPGFDRLPIEAVENAVGLTGAGSPVRDLLTETLPDAADAMTNQLIRSTALGINPRETARRMQDGSTRSLNRMLNIARTEQLRVYRQTARQSYQTSGVVDGYYRLATRDSRTCPACLMDDGHFYELDQEMPEHSSGRCTQIPRVTGVKPPQWQQGPDWFTEQPPETQRAILGKGRFDAWQAGEFDLDQLVIVKQNKTWGDSLQPKPLKELVSA